MQIHTHYHLLSPAPSFSLCPPPPPFTISLSLYNFVAMPMKNKDQLPNQINLYKQVQPRKPKYSFKNPNDGSKFQNRKN